MKVQVKVPATTANLGPGFDALGLALDLWNEAEFTCTDDKQISMTIEGEGADKLPTDATNAVADAALMIYDRSKKIMPGSARALHQPRAAEFGAGIEFGGPADRHARGQCLVGESTQRRGDIEACHRNRRTSR